MFLDELISSVLPRSFQIHRGIYNFFAAGNMDDTVTRRLVTEHGEIKMRINMELVPRDHAAVTYPLNLSALKSVTEHHPVIVLLNRDPPRRDTRALSTKITATN